MSIVVHAISIGPRVITAATSVNVDRGPSLYSPSPRFQSLLHMAVPRTNQIKINEAETHLITLFGETSPFIHKTVERETERNRRERRDRERGFNVSPVHQRSIWPETVILFWKMLTNPSAAENVNSSAKLFIHFILHQFGEGDSVTAKWPLLSKIYRSFCTVHLS